MDRYIPWQLRDGPDPRWGIKDTHTGVNVLGAFLKIRTGAFLVRTEEEVSFLISRGRIHN